jgi:hypothetical protein
MYIYTRKPGTIYIKLRKLITQQLFVFIKDTGWERAEFTYNKHSNFFGTNEQVTEVYYRNDVERWIEGYELGYVSNSE